MSRRARPLWLAFALALSLAAAGCGSAATPTMPASQELGAASATTPGPGGPSPTATPLPTARVRPQDLPTPAPSAAPSPVLAADVAAVNTTGRPVKAISAGSDICALQQNGAITCWAYPESPPPVGRYVALDNGEESACAIDTDGRLHCWGMIGKRVPKGRFTAVSVAQSEACAIRRDGSLACWFAADEYDSGDDSQPAEPPAGSFIAASVGDEFDCAIRTDGTLACWSDYPEDLPTVPSGTFSALDLPCAIRTNGELDCFGYHEAQVPEGTFTALSTSGWNDSGCVLRTDGTAVCWGLQGSDDDGNDLPMRTPVGTFVAVSVGDYQACAMRPDGRAVCWGEWDEAARPAPTMRLQLPRWVASSSIRVDWGAMPLFAPVTSYDVRYTINPDEDHAPVWVSWREATTQTHDILRVRSGATYCVDARARDADGVVSDWAESCTTLPRDEAAYTASSDWVRIKGSPFFGGSALRATEVGATLKLTGVDTWGLGILATTCPTCGTIKVSVGRQTLETVSLRSPTTVNRKLVLWTDNGEEGSSGTVRIKIVSSGRPVIIDGILLGPGPDD